MQELASSIQAAGNSSSPKKGLEDAAIDWSKHCLKTYSGSLLNKGLRISKDICNFLADLEGRQP